MATKTRKTDRATVGQEKVKATKRATVANVVEAEPIMLDKDQAMLAIMAEMQKQLKYQGDAIKVLLEKKGTTVAEQFSTPPSGNAVIVRAGENDHGPQPVIDPVDEMPPGTYFPDGKNWKPWSPQHLEGTPRKVVVPYPIPNLVWPEPDEEGNQKIRLIVNDLECWLTVGVAQEVYTFFSDIYDQAFDNWKNNEKFKRVGGRGPWVHGGPHGENTWQYKTDVISFHMDEDGRPVGIDRSIWDSLPSSVSWEGVEEPRYE